MAEGESKRKERTWVVPGDPESIEAEMLKLAGIIERIGGMVTVTAMRAEAEIAGEVLVETEGVVFNWRPYGGPVRSLVTAAPVEEPEPAAA